jgi:tetratricopeptide (TPR) repeat protein
MKNVMNKGLSNVSQKLVDRARFAEAHGCYALAFECLHRTIARDPSRPGLKNRAAANLVEIGRLSDAEAVLTSMRDVPKPKRWRVQLSLGELRMAQFRPVQAEKHFRRALALNPTSTVPAVFLADCLIKQEKTNIARRVLTKALSAKGDREEVYLNLALVARINAEYGAARAFLLKALRIAPDYIEAKGVLKDMDGCLRLEHELRRTACGRPRTRKRGTAIVSSTISAG